MQRVFVTGANGLIGSRVVQHMLQTGCDVTAGVFRHVQRVQSLPLDRVCQLDVTQPESLADCFSGCQTVIHCAGATLARQETDYLNVNAKGTAAVAAACVRCDPVPRLVYVSSLAALGPAPDRTPLLENATARPVSAYGRSKREAEQILFAFADKMPVTIVRPCSVISSDDPYLLPLFQWAVRGWVFAAVNAGFRYSFVHIDDLVQALTNISRAGKTVSSVEIHQGLYHIAAPHPMTFGELGSITARLFQRHEPRVVRLPAWVCCTLGWGGEVIDRLTGKRPLINRDKISEALGGSWLCDATKLQAEGLYDFPVTLNKRVEQTLRGYQMRGKLPLFDIR